MVLTLSQLFTCYLFQTFLGIIKLHPALCSTRTFPFPRYLGLEVLFSSHNGLEDTFTSVRQVGLLLHPYLFCITLRRLLFLTYTLYLVLVDDISGGGKLTKLPKFYYHHSCPRR